MYGFSMIVLVPTLNFIFRASLKEWRGPYYSLPAVRWYIHNGLTYVVRFTFLEFITPTPFNIFFFRMMGMKIGEGTLINSSHLSDPSLIELGRKVTLGGSVTIVAHYGQGGFLVLAPVKIGDKATIGLRAILMGGVTIGEGAKILPNSVVLPKTQVPAGETWGGVPARKIEAHELVKAA
jgi:acetyltransferase-like isoleucine patch superfamily enzyme